MCLFHVDTFLDNTSQNSCMSGQMEISPTTLAQKQQGQHEDTKYKQ